MTSLVKFEWRGEGKTVYLAMSYTGWQADVKKMRRSAKTGAFVVWTTVFSTFSFLFTRFPSFFRNSFLFLFVPFLSFFLSFLLSLSLSYHFITIVLLNSLNIHYLLENIFTKYLSFFFFLAFSLIFYIFPLFAFFPSFFFFSNVILFCVNIFVPIY